MSLRFVTLSLQTLKLYYEDQRGFDIHHANTLNEEPF